MRGIASRITLTFGVDVAVQTPVAAAILEKATLRLAMEQVVLRTPERDVFYRKIDGGNLAAL
jgi:hypothetical protein